MDALRMTRAKKVKRVMVVGAGLAGMEAARALALRGHKVTMYEKEEAPGRMLYVQSLAPFRTDMDLLRRYLTTQVKKLGVEVRCGEEVTVGLVEKEKPDVVVVATGCRPKQPGIPGVEKHPHVVFAEDVLLEKTDLGSRVVVIDADAGHDLAALGSFVAQYVARAACIRDDVAMHILGWTRSTTRRRWPLVEQPGGEKGDACDDPRAGGRGPLPPLHHDRDLRRLGVRVITECRYKGINEKGLVVVHEGKVRVPRCRHDHHLPIMSLTTRSTKSLRARCQSLYLVGDAKSVQVQYIANVHGPYRLALTI